MSPTQKIVQLRYRSSVLVCQLPYREGRRTAHSNFSPATALLVLGWEETMDRLAAWAKDTLEMRWGDHMDMNDPPAWQGGCT